MILILRHSLRLRPGTRLCGGWSWSRALRSRPQHRWMHWFRDCSHGCGYYFERAFLGRGPNGCDMCINALMHYSAGHVCSHDHIHACSGLEHESCWLQMYELNLLLWTWIIDLRWDTNELMHCQMNAWTTDWNVDRRNDWIDELTNAWTDKWMPVMNDSMDGCINALVNDLMNECLYGWVDGRMAGWLADWLTDWRTDWMNAWMTAVNKWNAGWSWMDEWMVN